MAALTDRKALWIFDYSAVRVTIDMAGGTGTPKSSDNVEGPVIAYLFSSF